jgi:hypothetical protein
VAVRSKRLAAFNGAAPYVQTVYTAPAGETVLVKSIAVYANAAGVKYFVGAVVAGVGATLYFATPAPPDATAEYFDVWVVLQPGDQITVQTTGVATGARILISGSELEGVAD